MSARRALLYVPGHDRRKIDKAAGLVVDAICLDLEDGVPAAEKAAARAIVGEVLHRVDFGESEVCVRVNGGDEDDVRHMLEVGCRLMVLPKIQTPADVHRVLQLIGDADVRLILMIETARSIVELPALCATDRRIEALILGAEDLATDMGAVRSPAATELLYARSAVVTCAAAWKLDAIDMVHIEFRDIQGLRAEARGGALMGFTGKQVIHPGQIEPVQTAFTPDMASIERARRLLTAAERAGFGAFDFEGQMVDMPLIKAAQRLLQRAR